MQAIPWNEEVQVIDGRYRAWRIGGLCMVAARKRAEWFVTSFRELVMPFPEEGEFDQLKNKDLNWQRWEGGQDDSKCLIRPSLPDMPVITRPLVPVTLPPGAKARFFIGVPAFVELVGECEKQMMPLLTTPMVKLSYTWRGADTPSGESKSNGEVCISQRRKVHTTYNPDHFDPGAIIIMIEIRNSRSTSLPFSRIRLDTDFLSLFLTDKHAWSNSCRLNSYDDASRDGIIYAKTPPPEAGEHTLLAQARLGAGRKMKKPGVLDIIADRFKLHI